MGGDDGRSLDARFVWRLCLGSLCVSFLGESRVLKGVLGTRLSWLLLLLCHVGKLVIPSSDVPQESLCGPL